MKTPIQNLFIMLALLAGIHQAVAQGTTAFTYQGQLRDGGTNANGAYTMTFKLYDAVSAGGQIGSTVTNSPTLANGLFTVNLDFGAGAFNGRARWLDITAQSGTDAPETLTPRVQVLPAPYALYAAVAATVTNGSIMNAQLAGNAVNTTNIQSGAVTNRNLTANAVNATNIASGQVVKSLNGLTDTVTLSAGTNITLTPSGNNLQISAAQTDFPDGMTLRQGAAGTTLWNVSVGNASGPPGVSFNNALKFSVNGVQYLALANAGGPLAFTPTLGANEVDCGELSVRNGSWDTVVYMDASGNIEAQGDIVAFGTIEADGNLEAFGNIVTLGNIEAQGDINADDNIHARGNITTDGNIIANGITGGYIHSTVNFDCDGMIRADGNIYGYDICGNTFCGNSDRNLKERFAPIDGREVLERVASLPISRWNFKTDTNTHHIGPMAQDFYAAFNVGPDDKHIATVDEGGVALAAIQGLHEVVKEKDAEIAAMKQRLTDLEKVVSALANRKGETP